MIIETILVILGILTTALGIWNIVVGAYIWGTLFLLGGIWAIGLGILYIVQIRKEKKRIDEIRGNGIQSTIESDETITETSVPDEGISAGELFVEATIITKEEKKALKRQEKIEKKQRKKKEKKKKKKSSFFSSRKKEEPSVNTEEINVESVVGEIIENPTAQDLESTEELIASPSEAVTTENLQAEDLTSAGKIQEPKILVTPPPVETLAEENPAVTEESESINLLSVIDTTRELVVINESKNELVTTKENELVLVEETKKELNESD